VTTLGSVPGRTLGFDRRSGALRHPAHRAGSSVHREQPDAV